MIKDFFKLAVENITHRKVRSWLTILGIVIGSLDDIEVCNGKLGVS